jgi:hypothetical protein
MVLASIASGSFVGHERNTPPMVPESRRRSPRQPLGAMLALGVVLSVVRPAVAEHESQEVAPTLDQVQPEAHFRDDPGQREAWRRRIKASLEFAAMATEAYRGDLVLFNARDGALPYYVARYLAGDDPGLDLRLMSLSPNTDSINRPETSAYLAQLGIHDQTIQQGRRIIFTDGSMGLARTFGRVQQEISGDLRPKLLAHVMMAFDENVAPTLRMALRRLADGAETMTPAAAFDSAQWSWEWGIPYGVNVVESYAEQDGRWVPMAPATAEADKQQARQWKAYMRHKLDQPIYRERWASRQQTWREVHGLLKEGKVHNLLGWLDAQYQAHRPAVAEALVRDVLVLARNHPRRFAPLHGPVVQPLREEIAAGRRESIREPLRAIRRTLAHGH